MKTRSERIEPKPLNAVARLWRKLSSPVEKPLRNRKVRIRYMVPC